MERKKLTNQPKNNNKEEKKIETFKDLKEKKKLWNQPRVFQPKRKAHRKTL